MLPITLLCIVFNALISSVPAVFQQNIIAIVEKSWQSRDWNGVSGQITKYVLILATFYALSLIAGFTYTRLMATITQGSLKKFRLKMFNGMEDLPIKYFDTNNHGDIMSYYTNDIDTLRQMISQSIPAADDLAGVEPDDSVHHAVLQCMASLCCPDRNFSDDEGDKEDRKQFCEVFHPAAD